MTVVGAVLAALVAGPLLANQAVADIAEADPSSAAGDPVAVGPPWRIVGAGIFAGRGDLLWYNSDTHETQSWHMDEEGVRRRETIRAENGQAALAGPPNSIVGVADFDGRLGAADIVWHNSQTNETQIWFVRGRQVQSRGTVLGVDDQPLLVGLPWRIVGAADFNGDGPADLLWHNSATNESQIWFMNRHRVQSRRTVIDHLGNAAIVGPPFRIVGAGDFNADRRDDVLWYNDATGETQIWVMEAQRVQSRTTVTGEDGLPAHVGPPFRIAAVGQFDVGGAADILWHNSATNRMEMWLTNGAGGVAGRRTVIDDPLPTP